MEVLTSHALGQQLGALEFIGIDLADLRIDGGQAYPIKGTYKINEGEKAEKKRIKFKNVVFDRVYFGKEYEPLEIISGIEGRVEFIGCKFQKCVMNIKLKNALFVDCEFSECRFVNSRFDKCSFKDVRFVNEKQADFASFLATEFYECSFAGERVAGGGVFKAQFIGQSFHRASFYHNCKFTSVQFSESAFHGAKFSRANLRIVRFDKCIMRDTLFEECDIEASALYKGKNDKTKFHKGELSNFRLRGGVVDDLEFDNVKSLNVELSVTRAQKLRISQSAFLMANICPVYVSRLEIVNSDISGAKIAVAADRNVLHLHHCVFDVRTESPFLAGEGSRLRRRAHCLWEKQTSNDYQGQKIGWEEIKIGMKEYIMISPDVEVDKLEELDWGNGLPAPVIFCGWLQADVEAHVRNHGLRFQGLPVQMDSEELAELLMRSDYAAMRSDIIKKLDLKLVGSLPQGDEDLVNVYVMRQQRGHRRRPPAPARAQPPASSSAAASGANGGEKK